MKRVGDLEVAEDLEFQKWEWRLERVALAVLGAFVLAALLGVFAVGPLGEATRASDDGTVSIEYERFTRSKAPTLLRVRLEREGDAGGTVRLALDREFVEAIEVEAVAPQPDSVEAGRDAMIFVFSLAETAPPTSFSFHYRPTELGVLASTVALGDASARFSQLVYP